jgi:hypothetical protein
MSGINSNLEGRKVSFKFNNLNYTGKIVGRICIPDVFCDDIFVIEPDVNLIALGSEYSHYCTSVFEFVETNE